MAKKPSKRGNDPAGNNPSNLGPPTIEELRKLPRWAVVAFAAQCARRAHPFILPRIADVASLDLQHAISECSSVSSSASGDLTALSNLAAALRQHEEHAGYQPSFVFQSAIFALGCAAATIQGSSNEERLEAAQRAIDLSICAFGVDPHRDHFVASLRHAFELLLAASAQDEWTDETPVSEEFFGPVWPEIEQKGWPAIASNQADARTNESSTYNLQNLPRWAAVAFAARCVRRLQPLFTDLWPNASRQQIDTIDRAISVTEKAAAMATEVPEFTGDDLIAGFASEVEHAATAAHAYISGVIAHAAEEAVRAAITHREAAATASNLAAFAIANPAIAPAVTLKAQLAMRRDLELLFDAARRERWTDATPVAPTFFGPIWPEGAPDGWPSSTPPSQSPTAPPAIWEKLSKLPRAALIAFAARCSRRIQPLHRHYWPDVSLSELQEIETDITDAEHAAMAAVTLQSRLSKGSLIERLVDSTPQSAALRTATAARASATIPYASPGEVTHIVRDTFAALNGVAGSNSQLAVAGHQAVLQDLNLLVHAAKEGRWLDNTPVPPQFFGQMWAQGQPEGWPKQLDVGQVPVLIAAWDPKFITPDEYATLIAAIGDLVRADGGEGLVKIREIGVASTCPPVEVLG